MLSLVKQFSRFHAKNAYRNSNLCMSTLSTMSGGSGSGDGAGGAVPVRITNMTQSGISEHLHHDGSDMHNVSKHTHFGAFISESVANSSSAHHLVMTSVSPNFRPHGNPLAGRSFDMADSDELKRVNVDDDDERNFFLKHAKQLELEALEQDLSRLGGVPVDLFSAAENSGINVDHHGSEFATNKHSSTLVSELAIASVELEFHKHEASLDRLAQQEQLQSVDRLDTALTTFQGKEDPSVRDLLNFLAFDRECNVAVYDMGPTHSNGSIRRVEYLIFTTVPNEQLLAKVVEGMAGHARAVLSRKKNAAENPTPASEAPKNVSTTNLHNETYADQKTLDDGSSLLLEQTEVQLQEHLENQVPQKFYSDSELNIVTMNVTGDEADPWTLVDFGQFVVQVSLGSSRKIQGAENVCAGNQLHRFEWHTLFPYRIEQCIIVHRSRSNVDGSGQDRSRKTKNRRHGSRHLLKSHAISALVEASTSSASTRSN